MAAPVDRATITGKRRWKLGVSSELASSVGDAMHRGVIACGPETSAFAVARIMAAHRIHSVVVVADDGACLGIVCDTELEHALSTGAPSEFAARDIAVTPVLVDLSDSVEHALQRMHERGTTHAVVTYGAKRRAVGVLSMLDVAELLSEGGAP
jgi:CBS domain-containing protein